MAALKHQTFNKMTLNISVMRLFLDPILLKQGFLEIKDDDISATLYMRTLNECVF